MSREQAGAGGAGPRGGPDRVDSAAGWLVVGAACTSMFVVFGVGYSFGAFFESITDEFGTGSGATAVVFGVTIGLSFVLATFTGGWTDCIGPRRVALAGAAALVAGLLLTVVVPSIWLAYLTYGLGVGTAIACGYVPMVAAVSGWFVERRALAVGVAVAGIGFGTLVANPIAAALIAASSWRTAFLVFAAVGGSALVAVAAVVRPGPAAIAVAQRRRLGELLGVADFRYLFLSLLCLSLGLFVPFVFLSPYAQDRGHSGFAGAVLVGLVGGASVVGRLAIGGLGDRYDSLRLCRLAMGAMAASQLIWLVAGSNYPLLVLFAAIYGSAYGGFIALSPAVAADRFGLEGIGAVLGGWYTAAGFGALVGPPLAGFLTDQAGSRAAIVAAALAMSAGTAVITRLAVAS